MVHGKDLAKQIKLVVTESGNPERAADNVQEAFKKGIFSFDDISLKALAIEMLGEQWYEGLTPSRVGNVVVHESGGAVDSTTFANLLSTIIGGLIDAEPAQADLQLAESLVSTRRVPRERGERMVALTKVGREANRSVREGEEYSAFGFSEHWIDMPDTAKYGGYVLLTKEMIAEDETGQALDAARSIIEEARFSKAERILLAVTGVNNAIYKPQGNVEATYTAATSGLHNNSRVNLVASGGELLDWTDIDEALQRWTDMADVETGRPLSISPSQMRMIVMPAKLMVARQIMNATQLETGTVTTTGVRTTANPVAGLAQPESSALMYHLLTRSASDPYRPGGGVSASDAQKYWYIGDFKRAFEYREQWPISVETVGADTLLAFQRDVIFGVKVSEKGVVAVKDPRYVQQIRQA